VGSLEFDLRRYDREQAEGEELMDMAEAKRSELVREYMADDAKKNERSLLDILGDTSCDAEFLHALQRGDVGRMQKLFRDQIDHCMGDELVQLEAQRLGER